MSDVIPFFNEQLAWKKERLQVLPTIQSRKASDEIILRYCMSYWMQALRETLGIICLLPDAEVPIIDFVHNKTVLIRKEWVMEGMAQYLEARGEQRGFP
jgi:hypothetical protein